MAVEKLFLHIFWGVLAIVILCLHHQFSMELTELRMKGDIYLKHPDLIPKVEEVIQGCDPGDCDGCTECKPPKNKIAKLKS